MRSLALAALGLSLVLGAGCPAPREAPEGVLARACRYLWAQQADDGGWHSDTHGLLRSGQAWTPFVALALLEAPEAECPRPAGGPGRALAFVRRHLDAGGALGRADPDVLEYPNYATAYALRLFVHAGLPEDSTRIRQMTAYLAGQQFTEVRGIGSAHPAYGGWGFGEVGLRPGQAGHVDLSHTRRALEALRAAGHADTATYRAADVFLARLQNVQADSATYDGGFFASLATPAVNKSAPEGAGFSSYATATADGLLALRALGRPRGDDRLDAAAAWLAAHPALDAPAGLDAEHPAGWPRVLFFYHLAVRAEAAAALGDALDRIEPLLAPRQHPDGHFANPHGALNKEDDPLLATALAVIALSREERRAKREGGA